MSETRIYTQEEAAEMMKLLNLAAAEFESSAPGEHWFRRYFTLTGAHMILTEEGWEWGAAKASYLSDPDYGEDYIMDEVNAPPS